MLSTFILSGLTAECQYASHDHVWEDDLSRPHLTSPHLSLVTLQERKTQVVLQSGLSKHIVTGIDQAPTSLAIQLQHRVVVLQQ